MATLFKHHKKGNYGRFPSKSGSLRNYPYIIEIVFNDKPTENKVFTSIKVDCSSNKFNSEENEFYNYELGFFDKVIVYNNNQCTGEVNLKLKEDGSSSDYFSEILEDNIETVTCIKKEGNWLINGFRNIIQDNTVPMFSKSWNKIQDYFPIDKVVNSSAINYEKDWREQELLRSKYLIVRFIDDNEDSYKQLTTKIIDSNTLNSAR